MSSLDTSLTQHYSYLIKTKVQAKYMEECFHFLSPGGA